MTEQCKFIKKNGLQCGGKSKKGFEFCGPHLGTPNKSPRCQYFKRNGQPCRGFAMRGSKYCGSHQNPF